MTSPSRDSPRIVTLCTGNAVRSVILGVALADFSGAEVLTAGTHVVEGMSMSRRTREVLDSLGFVPPVHRSRQVTREMMETADLVVAASGEHVEWVRRSCPEMAGRVATLRRLVRDLELSSRPLSDRVEWLRLDGVEIKSWEDISDPIGGEPEEFLKCAREIVGLARELSPMIRGKDPGLLMESRDGEMAPSEDSG